MTDEDSLLFRIFAGSKRNPIPMKKSTLKILFLAVLTIVSSSIYAQNKMQYRPLGKTGMQISEIGIGCSCFEKLSAEQSMSFMDSCIKYGVNYVDIYDSNPLTRDNLGNSLKGRRDKMNIQGHIGVCWKDGQYKRTRDLAEAQAGFEDLLTRLHTDHIEVGMIHIADDIEDWNVIKNGDIMKYAQQLKKEGKIQHIGLSSHNAVVALEAVRSGLIEVLMFSVNPAFDLLPGDANIWKTPIGEGQQNIDSIRALLYNTCAQMGVGITVMKAFNGGRLLDEKKSPIHVAMTESQCIQYGLDRPAVASILAGAGNVEELMADLHYINATPAEKDYSVVFSKTGFWKNQCIYCGHCAPCPAGIDIDKVNKLLDQAEVEGNVTPEMQKEYDALQHKASECFGCGACESRCPFAVSVREKMKKAAKTFEKR